MKIIDKKDIPEYHSKHEKIKLGENLTHEMYRRLEKLNLSKEDRIQFILEEKWITYPNAKEMPQE